MKKPCSAAFHSIRCKAQGSSLPIQPRQSMDESNHNPKFTTASYPSRVAFMMVPPFTQLPMA